jgi:competence protein ComEC
LFTADIRQDIELELVGQRVDLRSTVLKVAHHGSKTSTTSQFLAAVSPDIAAICVGEDNPYGHPNPEVMQRLNDVTGGDNVYCTDVNGTIEFITDGQRLWVTTTS